MLQKTHTLAGLLTAECVVAYYHQPFLTWEAGAALLLGCLAGPMADIDKKGSTMAKVFLPLSWALQLLRVKHRTVTHSLLFILALFAILSPLPDLFLWTAVLSYASHAFIDMFNDQGVALLWPWNKKIGFLPKFLAVDTGSFAEGVIRLALGAAVIVYPFVGGGLGIG
ncbi:metal-dependent hydrolase [Paenibacillus sp. M1]|uniref:Metal-dependent hydrolase n=1 Tax=Paenibacillus haidiansis TaxID=1574488 RepID=A0ABU7VQN4_9BACL